MASGTKPLLGHVCVVTGASRGVGKGIALQLSEAGATVYITARHQETLDRTASEVQGRGGKCVPVVCDSTQEENVVRLFERVRQEQAGRLDILVCSAFSAVMKVSQAMGQPFWESDASLWDEINNAGLRGNYFCAVYAARLMVPAGRGLIVILSSPGGLRYMFDVPYGVGKAACDRLAADCGVDLRPFGVACVALWPGLVRTELVMQQQNSIKKIFKDLSERLVNKAESPELSGKCVVALATDPQVMQHSGKVVLTPDLAHLYGFKDVDEQDVYNYISLRDTLTEIMPKLSFLFWFIPGFISVPKWALDLYSSKFAVYSPIQPAYFEPVKKD